MNIEIKRLIYGDGRVNYELRQYDIFVKERPIDKGWQLDKSLGLGLVKCYKILYQDPILRIVKIYEERHKADESKRKVTSCETVL